MKIEIENTKTLNYKLLPMLSLFSMVKKVVHSISVIIFNQNAGYIYKALCKCQ